MTHACETIFGWTLRGNVLSEPKTDRVHLCDSAKDSSIDDLLRAFRVEQAPESYFALIDEDQQAVDHFQKSYSRDVDGRYVVQLPKRNTSIALGCSRDQALRRYIQNRRALEK